MRMRILGTLEVWDGTRWCHLGAPRRRALLAVLIVNAGRPVPVERLIDEVWGDDPPRTVATQVHDFVAGLRQLLGESGAELLRTQSPGYRLMLDEDDLDATVFESLTEQGAAALRADDPERAVTLFTKALALWRGPAFTDVPQTDAARTAADRLQELLLTAITHRIDAELRLGRHQERIPELSTLVEEHPYRERLWQLLMIALHRSGRQADALSAYLRLRRILDDDLGIEPSEPLRELHQQILTGGTLETPRQTPPAGPASPPAPRQLPAAIADFTGRDEQLAALDKLLGGAGLTIVTISGIGGVGKTALALHWCHRVAERFPDGQLHLDLRGNSTDARPSTHDLLGRLIRALGVPADQVPMDIAEAGALYRSLIADRRMVIMLDDAAGAEQIRPLLPGSADCLTVITSRRRLIGLIARDGAHPLDLDQLPDDECNALLARMIGVERLAAEPEAAAALIGLCDRLPLALRIVAAQLAVRPDRPIGDLVADLRSDDRLDLLAIDDDRLGSVRAALDASWRSLDPELQRLFGLLGLAGDLDLTADVVAALADLTPAHTRRLLDQLLDVSLLDHHAGRYALHDLTRLYAAERGRDVGDRASARLRLFDFFLQRAADAARLITPFGARLDRTRAAEPDPPIFDAADDALAWLDRELGDLIVITRLAADHDHPAAWLLTDALSGYFAVRRQVTDWLTVAEAGLRAARARTDSEGEAAAELGICRARRLIGDYDAAIEHGERAVALSRQAGWAAGEADALNEIAVVHGERGVAGPLIDILDRALNLEPVRSNPHDHSAMLMNIGLAHLLTGDLERALARAEQAYAMLPESAPPNRTGTCLANLATVHRMLGDHDTAADYAERALCLQRDNDFRPGIVFALDVAARIDLDTGRPERARSKAAEALALARELGSPRATTRVLLTAGALAAQPQAALDHFRAALDLATERGNHYLETEARLGIAEALRADGRPEDARAEAATAWKISEQFGYRLLAERAAALTAP